MIDSGESDELLRPRIGIFVDANHLFSMFSEENNWCLEMLDLVSQAGNAVLLISEITRFEVAKNLAERDCKEILPVNKNRFRRVVNEMLNVQLQQVDMTELYLQAYSRYLELIEKGTSWGRWECLELSGIDLLDIFAQYGSKKGLFADETKKHQFADAVVFEQLKRKADASMPVFIFSRDKDFEGVARESENIKLAKTWEDLFQLLGMSHDVPEAVDLFNRHRDVIIKEIADWFDKTSAKDGDEYQTNTLDYIIDVDVKQGGGIRFGEDILVSGQIDLRAQLPLECPISYMRRWETNGFVELEDTMDVAEVVCEIYLLALIYDLRQEFGREIKDGKQMLDGLLELENIGFGYKFKQIKWIVGEA